MYASAQPLDFLDLAKNCSFLNWKLTVVPIIQRLICGWALDSFLDCGLGSRKPARPDSIIPILFIAPRVSSQ
jgi:hypothetical protein